MSVIDYKNDKNAFLNKEDWFDGDNEAKMFLII
jgi:hypothetical protein